MNSNKHKRRRLNWTAALLSFAVLTQLLVAEDKPTSVSDARDAVEANLRTSEGKKYDELMGTEFPQKHLSPLRKCKQTAGDDKRNFWMLFKLDRDGTVKELPVLPGNQTGNMCPGSAPQRNIFRAAALRVLDQRLHAAIPLNERHRAARSLNKSHIPAPNSAHPALTPSAAVHRHA